MGRSIVPLQKLSCQQRLTRKRRNGKTEHYHIMRSGYNAVVLSGKFPSRELKGCKTPMNTERLQ